MTTAVSPFTSTPPDQIIPPATRRKKASILIFPLFSTILLIEVGGMLQRIQTIYWDGVLKPLHKLDLSERQAVGILILEDDLPASHMAEVAGKAGSYNFLGRSGKDIYTAEDGEGLA